MLVNEVDMTFLLWLGVVSLCENNKGSSRRDGGFANLNRGAMLVAPW